MHLFFYRNFYCPVQLAEVFTLNDFLGKPWSQESSLIPLGTCVRFCRAQSSVFPLLVDFHRTFVTHTLYYAPSSRLFKPFSFAFTGANVLVALLWFSLGTISLTFGGLRYPA